MSSIDRESEDIFANDDETDNEDSLNNDVEVKEAQDEDACELSAAVALTSLVVSEPSSSRLNNTDPKQHEDYDDEDMELQIPQRLTKSGRKRAVSFPLKLLKVLSTKKHSDVIAWTPSGKAFEIRKPKQFVVDILPKYFKSAKYSSFTRKLHRWNFQRHYRGEEAGAFYHPEFMKDRLDLVEQMTCKHDGPAPASKPKQRKSKPTSPAPRKNPSSKTKAAVKTAPAQVPTRPIVTLNANQVIGNFPTMARADSSVAEPSTSVGLNAAIEMEVTRRLEERISAAAFSRQALAMLEHQQQQHQQIQASLNAMIERRYQALLSQQGNLAASSSNAVFPMAPPQAPPSRSLDLASSRPLDLAQIYQKFKPAPSYSYAFGDDTPALPPTNIQGARTA